MGVVETFFRNHSLAAIVVTLCLGIGVYLWRKRPKNFPPGPIGLPILGSAHKMSSRSELDLMKMSRKYGAVVGIKMFRQFTVVLSSQESIQQAFSRQGNEFSGRPISVILEAFTDKNGIVGIDGEKWRTNRKFGTTAMRRLGAGKTVMENWIYEEACCLCKKLQEFNGKEFNINKTITHSVANILCRLIFGERFDYDDEAFVNTSRSLVDWFSDNSNTFMALILAPFLRFIPPFRSSIQSLKESKFKLYTMLKPIIQRHKDTFDNYDCRDFVDAYLQAMEKNKDNKSSFFNDDDLLGYSRDLFVAGTDTTVAALRWTIVCLINRPWLQTKIQNEVDEVIGPDARPKMQHFDEMHYTKAVMYEMLRYRTPGPLGLVHRTEKDTTLMGYSIPKNTQVVANLWALHHDPALWKDPDNFNPERFLDDNGEFKTNPNMLAFSIGARHCIGETIAKMEFFLFIVCLMQRFHLKSSMMPITEESERSGQFLIPPNFVMRAQERFSFKGSIRKYKKNSLTLGSSPLDKVPEM